MIQDMHEHLDNLEVCLIKTEDTDDYYIEEIKKTPLITPPDVIIGNLYA